MDIPGVYINKDKCGLTAYFGQFVTESHINDNYKLSFSCDPDDYFEILQKYSFCDRHRSTIIKGVHGFIDSCLILGNFLHDILRVPYRIFNYNCETEFNLRCIVDHYGNHEIRNRFLNLWVVIRTSTLGGQISINVSGHKGDCPTSTEIRLTCPQNLLIYSPPMVDIRRTPETDVYRIMNRIFSPPPYRKLPLYINDVFIKEYVQMMFKNPPPPPPQYVPTKNTFSYI